MGSFSKPFFLWGLKGRAAFRASLTFTEYDKKRCLYLSGIVDTGDLKSDKKGRNSRLTT
jgi:hypothetical protein